MNYFTKEELELIQDNLHWNDCSEKNKHLLEVSRKIQVLIDNYDERFILTDEQLKLAQEDDYIPAPDC